VQSKQLNLTDFRYGLDSRRSELTSRSGVLIKCENAHINQGAEVEKRKAFVKTGLPNETFGLLATTSGLLTFGSRNISAFTGPVNLNGLAATYNHITGVFQITFSPSSPAYIIGDKIIISGLLPPAAIPDPNGTRVITGNTGTVVSFNIGTSIFGFSGNLVNGTIQLQFPYPFQYQQLNDPNTTPTLYNIIAIGPNSLGILTQFTISGLLPSYFVVGSVFTVSGITNPQLFYLNGPQVVTGMSVSGGNTLITAGGRFPLGAGTSTGNITIKANTTALTSIVAACLFNDFAFVVAYFGTDIGIFYNGGLVNDFFSGQMFSNITSNANLATELANYLNATKGYIASVSGAVVTCTSVNPSDLSKATPGGNFSANPTITSTAGTLVVTPLSQAVESIIGESAVASFTITAIDQLDGAGSIAHVYIDNVGNTDLLSGIITAGTVNALAAAVALNINTTNPIVGISAQSNGGTVIITLPPGSSNNDALLLVIANARACVDSCYFIVNIGSTGALTLTSIVPTGGVNILSAPVVSSGTTFNFVKAIIANLVAGSSGYTGGSIDLGTGSIALYISRLSVSSNSPSIAAVATWSTTGNGTISLAQTNAGFSAKLSRASVASNISGDTIVGAVPTPSVTAIPIGGKGPFLYQWNFYSGSNEVKVGSPTKATVAFTADIISSTNANAKAQSNNLTRPISGIVTAKFSCTITDTGITPNVIAITPPLTVTVAYITGFTKPLQNNNGYGFINFN